MQSQHAKLDGCPCELDAGEQLRMLCRARSGMHGREITTTTRLATLTAHTPTKMAPNTTNR